MVRPFCVSTSPKATRLRPIASHSASRTVTRPAASGRSRARATCGRSGGRRCRSSRSRPSASGTRRGRTPAPCPRAAGRDRRATAPTASATAAGSCRSAVHARKLRVVTGLGEQPRPAQGGAGLPEAGAAGSGFPGLGFMGGDHACGTSASAGRKTSQTSSGRPSIRKVERWPLESGRPLVPRRAQHFENQRAKRRSRRGSAAGRARRQDRRTVPRRADACRARSACGRGCAACAADHVRANTRAPRPASRLHLSAQAVTHGAKAERIGTPRAAPGALAQHHREARPWRLHSRAQLVRSTNRGRVRQSRSRRPSRRAAAAQPAASATAA